MLGAMRHSRTLVFNASGPRRTTSGSPTPPSSALVNRLEAQFKALRYLAVDGTDHASHQEPGQMIPRYILWRNRFAHDRNPREDVARGDVA
jgi:hypothetical protein